MAPVTTSATNFSLLSVRSSASRGWSTCLRRRGKDDKPGCQVSFRYSLGDGGSFREVKPPTNLGSISPAPDTMPIHRRLLQADELWLRLTKPQVSWELLWAVVKAEGGDQALLAWFNNILATLQPSPNWSRSLMTLTPQEGAPMKRSDVRRINLSHHSCFRGCWCAKGGGEDTTQGS